MRIKNLKLAGVIFLSVMLVLATMVVFTMSGFTSKNEANGLATLERQYDLIVTKTGSTEQLESSSIEITSEFYSGNATAEIGLNPTEITATSINNGTITGNYKKYEWLIDNVNTQTESLIYNVYSANFYTYYPKLVIKIMYTESNPGFKDVHLSFNTTQNQIFSIHDEQGTYYSYYVMNGQRMYLVTYPVEVQSQGNSFIREVTCIPIGSDFRPLAITGPGLEQLGYTLTLTDIFNGVYFDTSYSGNASVVVDFMISDELPI